LKGSSLARSGRQLQTHDGPLAAARSHSLLKKEVLQ